MARFFPLAPRRQPDLGPCAQKQTFPTGEMASQTATCTCMRRAASVAAVLCILLGTNGGVGCIGGVVGHLSADAALFDDIGPRQVRQSVVRGQVIVLRVNEGPTGDSRRLDRGLDVRGECAAHAPDGGVVIITTPT
jgi:hypothetical protein